MTRNESEIRRVRRVVEEVKASGVPAVKWAALERELFSELDGIHPEGPLFSESEHAKSRRKAHLLWALSAAAAVLVALAGMWEFHAFGTSAVPPQPTLASARTWTSQAVKSAETRVGDRFVASHTDITITDERLGRWTLYSGGEATLLRREPLVLQLAQGELLAEITPGHGPGAFSVQAAQTRVSVKGTIFRVRRQLDRVHVEVERGAVSVSSLEDSRPTYELKAPARADFSLDASRGQIWEPKLALGLGQASAKSSVGMANVASGNAAPTPNSVPNPQAEVAAATLSLKQVDAGIDALTLAAGACLSDTVASSGQLTLTFVTQARISVDPEGTPTEVTLAPPLLAKADACLQQRLHLINFGLSRKGAELFRRLEIQISPRQGDE